MISVVESKWPASKSKAVVLEFSPKVRLCLAIYMGRTSSSSGSSGNRSGHRSEVGGSE